MQLKYLIKDVMEVGYKRNHHTVVMHGTNCKNAFGSGFAGAVAKRWPIVKEAYHKCQRKALGEVQSVVTPEGVIVFNCFTQENYGYDGKRYADPNAILKCVNTCLHAGKILSEVSKQPIRFYMPRIGCDLGGLDWVTEVRPELIALLNNRYYDFDACLNIIRRENDKC